MYERLKEMLAKYLIEDEKGRACYTEHGPHRNFILVESQCGRPLLAPLNLGGR